MRSPPSAEGSSGPDEAARAGDPQPRPSALTSELLGCLVAIADAGGVTRAARTLGLSQPAVSQKLRRLERSAERRLVRRGSTGDRLTPDGAALLPHARAVMRAIADAEDHLRASSHAGSVCLGVCESVASGRLPDLLDHHRRTQPGVRLRIEVGSGEEMDIKLGRGEIDLALGEVADDPDRADVVWSDPLVWVGAPGAVDLALRRPLPIVLSPPPDPTARIIEAALRRAGVEYGVAVISASAAGIRASVLAGLGITACVRPATPHGLVELPAAGARLPALPDLPVGLKVRAGRSDGRAAALAAVFAGAGGVRADAAV